MPGKHRDHTDDDTERNQGRCWETPLIRDESDSPIGVCIFLAKEDLVTMGLDPDSQEEFYYRISDEGQIQLSERDRIS
jgi:hypothetical protein